MRALMLRLTTQLAHWGGYELDGLPYLRTSDRSQLRREAKLAHPTKSHQDVEWNLWNFC